MTNKHVPEIEVGIIRSDRIRFRLDGEFRIQGSGSLLHGDAEARATGGKLEIRCQETELVTEEAFLLEPEDPVFGRFTLREVVIGIGFHWEQKEDQEFQGALKLMLSGGEIQVVNVISVEDYLISVISSEMRGDSSPELLKAHTIISRSWLLAQIEKQDVLAGSGEAYNMEHLTDEEYIRWYDREDHELFHVCADDHCQRYQGTTRSHNPEVVKAVRETAGEVLEYGGRICDARFSKCCGGVVEEFQYCWEPVIHPYLKRVEDHPRPDLLHSGDLKVEANAVRFIRDSPEAFCNTSDADLLRQVLNDYDQGSSDFFRWEVEYSQEEIASLIREKSGMDFGQILDLVPVERGESGRLVRLKIIGSKKTLIMGKELEIRRWLSSSHLYSSAFVVEKLEIKNGVPGHYLLRGAGWGHGVGLCQIGAAVMAGKGYSHREILNHYFMDAGIEKRYESYKS
ncbi:MAG: SpoIID/LytB domain-containing protein [Bacteroidales bacterium]|nr:SpoIID/LytB domain-containing protein [Bacteroidales bacterium]